MNASFMTHYFVWCLTLFVWGTTSFAEALPVKADPPPCPIVKSQLDSFPDCINLPLEVGTAVLIDKIEKIDESAETFFARFDLVLRWVDPRLKFTESLKEGVRKDYMGQQAVSQIQTIWKPDILFNNGTEEVRAVDQALAIHSDGLVVWSRRMHGKFRSEFNLDAFPFDRQALGITMTIASLPSRAAQFVHRDADRRRSMLAATVNQDDTWTFEHLSLTASEQRTINGDLASQLNVTLYAARDANAYVPQVFLPLIVTILLPLLGLWVMNTEIHERINWSITGVFSLIALNFSVSLQYPALGPDSLVMQFFWIGYGLQCFMFIVLLVIYNLPVAEALFSRWVHQSLLQWMRWAIPTITLTMMSWAMLLASW